MNDLEKMVIQEKKPSRLVHVFIYLFIGFTIAGMLLFAYWQFYPYEPFRAQVQPFPIEDEDGVLQAGDRLVYHSETCRDFEGWVKVNRSLVNDILISYTPYTYYETGGECVDFSDHTISLPASIPNGTYHLEIIVTVQVNPIRTISTRFITEDFIVRNPVLELNEKEE